MSSPLTDTVSNNLANQDRKRRDALDEIPWPVRLFERSPLKQKKLAKIQEFIAGRQHGCCLDIGSDNGVISYYLRKQASEQAGEVARWYSCDLAAEAVASIRELVDQRVAQIDGRSTPYRDQQFDLVVIVDLLEHIETDGEFVNELYRILTPGGTLVINVPNPKEGLLRKIRFLLGQTDAAHGHVRPGYSLEALEDLLGDSFRIESSSSYSRLFSLLIDTIITFAIDTLKRGSHTSKGNVVTMKDVRKFEKSFRLYSFVYPVVSLFVKLDQVFSFLHGNMLIVRCAKAENRSELRKFGTGRIERMPEQVE